MFKVISSLLFSLLLFGCASHNANVAPKPNDTEQTSEQFNQMFLAVQSKAKAGEPWAQLALGISYENGWGVKRDMEKAVFWYKKVVAQKQPGAWSSDKIDGVKGKSDHLNNDTATAGVQPCYSNEFVLEQLVNRIEDVLNGKSKKLAFFRCRGTGDSKLDNPKVQEFREKIRQKFKELN